LRTQDYETIAEVVKSLPDNATKLHIACAFIDVLGEQSSRFKANKFIKSCGVTYPVDDKEVMDAQDIQLEMKLAGKQDDTN
jgi:hypothetical protein